MSNQPNILLINVDQQRYDSLGFTGHPTIRTPHLDQLASRGAQFSSAYTPFPICCPARQTLLSGVMPEQHGGLWNYDHGGGTLPVREFSPDRPLWTRQLREAGYATAYLGKWHVHPHLDPTSFGFDSFDEVAEDGSATASHGIKHPLPDNPWPQFPIGGMSRQSLERSHTHRIAAACNDKIDELSEQPWHIRLDFAEPHLPCLPAEPFASMYPPETLPPWENFEEDFQGKPYIQGQQVRNWGLDKWTWKEWSVYVSGYFGIISQVDDAIGKVMSHLERKNLLDRTLIIYTTDHGDAAGSHRMMDKHYVMYEEVTRVPLIFRWDGVIPAGTICGDFVSHFLDLPVTLLDLLDLPVDAVYQGRSFLPQLRGIPSPDPRPFAFSSYNGQQFGLYCQRMIRDRRYKYVWNATDIDECYDLKSDPFERHNLAARDENAPLCRKYRRQVHQVFAELNDPLVTGLWNARWLRGEHR